MAVLAQVATQLESGEWLSRERLRLYVTILLACELAVFAFMLGSLWSFRNTANKVPS